MYVIVRGRISIQSEPTGAELVELRDGDFFGEIALLNEVIRTATARAKTDCTLLSLFQPDLIGLLERSPRMGVKILQALARLVGVRLVEVSEELLALKRTHEALCRDHEALCREYDVRAADRTGAPDRLLDHGATDPLA
jgi:CRP-like cAMP-binding protein